MDLQPYSHNRFSKISRAFFASRNWWIFVVFLQRTLKENFPFNLINTLLLHIPLLALTHRWMEWQTEERIHSLQVGWRNFFSSCAVVSVFWLWRKIILGVTYLPYHLWRCVFFLVVVGNSFGLHRSVFWLWREIVLGVTYLPTIPVVPLCQFLVAAGYSFWLHSF
jgi:hypothetical protein